MNFNDLFEKYLKPLCEYFKEKLLDGYVVYKHLARINSENVHLFCWAHVRAKFEYIEKISKNPDAFWFVEQIGLLYMVEAERKITYILNG